MRRYHALNILVILKAMFAIENLRFDVRKKTFRVVRIISFIGWGVSTIGIVKHIVCGINGV
jgi:hypothetical protein